MYDVRSKIEDVYYFYFISIYHNADYFRIEIIIISWHKYNNKKKNLVICFFFITFARLFINKYVNNNN